MEINRQNCYHVIWQKEYTIYPYWFEKAINFDKLESHIYSILGDIEGIYIHIMADKIENIILGYTITICNIEIDTHSFVEENREEIIKELISATRPFYIIAQRDSEEYSIYKQIGYHNSIEENLLVL